MNKSEGLVVALFIVCRTLNLAIHRARAVVGILLASTLFMVAIRYALDGLTAVLGQ